MFGDQEVTLSVALIPKPKELLKDLEVLIKNSTSLDEYQGLIAARRLIAQAIQTEHVKQTISQDLLTYEAEPGHIMNWTVESMKTELKEIVLGKFDVTITVFNKED